MCHVRMSDEIADRRVFVPSFVVECAFRLLLFDMCSPHSAALASRAPPMLRHTEYALPSISRESTYGTSTLLECYGQRVRHGQLQDNCAQMVEAIWNISIGCITTNDSEATQHGVNLVEISRLERLVASLSGRILWTDWIDTAVVSAPVNATSEADETEEQNVIWEFLVEMSEREKSDEYERFSRGVLCMCYAPEDLPNHVTPATAIAYLGQHLPDTATEVHECTRQGTKRFHGNSEYSQRLRDASALCLFDYYMRQTIHVPFFSRYVCTDASVFRPARVVSEYLKERMVTPPGIIMLLRHGIFLITQPSKGELRVERHGEVGRALFAWLVHVRTRRNGRLGISTPIRPFDRMLSSWATSRHRTQRPTNVSPEHRTVESKCFV